MYQCGGVTRMTRMARIVIRRAIKVTGLNLGINTVASPWLPIDIS